MPKCLNIYILMDLLYTECYYNIICLLFSIALHITWGCIF